MFDNLCLEKYHPFFAGILPVLGSQHRKLHQGGGGQDHSNRRSVHGAQPERNDQRRRHPEELLQVAETAESRKRLPPSPPRRGHPGDQEGYMLA